jgi:hypothetical protein
MSGEKCLGMCSIEIATICCMTESVGSVSVSSLPASSGEDTWRATAIEIVAGKPSECLWHMRGYAYTVHV